MKRRHIWIMLTLLSPLLFAGCSRQIVVADNPAPIRAEQYEACFDSAIQVLRDNSYVIDRRDYRFGRVTTLPQGSPNLVEIWNDQNTTADQAIESTLASEQRRVNVTFTKAIRDVNDAPTIEVDADYIVEVEVILERKQIPTRRMAGSARRNVFSDLSAPPQDLIDRGVTTSYWQPVGRDPYMEARLIKQIIDRVGTIK